MRETEMKIYCWLIALAIFFGVAAHGSTKTRAEGRGAPAGVAGGYKYEVPRRGETPGYVNYMAVEDKGGGRLAVYFNAADIYDAGGVESSHETNAGGDLTLRGNTASGKISEQDGEGDVGSPCPVTITFAAGRATVKSAAGCGFRVSIDGVYRKESARPKGEEEKYVAHVEYVRLDEYINSDPYPPQPGEEFVVENAHMIDEIGRDYGKGGKTFEGLYWLTADIDSDIVTSFRAAADLAEALRPKLSTRPHHLRVECVLVEVSDTMETYRSAFATAVEAVGADGKTLWRVTGSKPKSVKIRY
jgi:hypothetical protein